MFVDGARHGLGLALGFRVQPADDALQIGELFTISVVRSHLLPALRVAMRIAAELFHQCDHSIGLLYRTRAWPGK